MIVSCDGAARGNPGPAGIGAFITTAQGEVLAEIGEGIGDTTNNVAEYRAVIAGLERARDLGATRVHLRSDSQLLVNQLSGVYRVKSPHLQPLHRQVRGLIAGFALAKIDHVPRERNKDADRLANLGVDIMLAARRQARRRT